ncbi:uncharacterized protein LOC143732878 [Siphateles boraxobius]|uniref:uncharacterized protein LOC143732878 n=1 Tax=Siphateles boraxobius TaxID=180520 RepID=UPI004063E8CE
MADDSFKKEFLETHNRYREHHQAPALVYSEDLCVTAQQWADHMLSNNALGHSDTDHGENVFYSFSSDKKTPTGKEAVDSWYSEIKDYDFEKPGHQPKTGHFTQVVWKSSTELGVGLATDGKTIFVVGQYKPAGNITNAGYYQENVLPKTGFNISEAVGDSRVGNASDGFGGDVKLNIIGITVKVETMVSNDIAKGEQENRRYETHIILTHTSVVFTCLLYTSAAMADDSFKKEFLETHNRYREHHQAPALVYSEDLCVTAQQWADHMLSNKALGHSDTDHGENVFYSFSSVKKTPTGKEAVDSWYSEIKDYDFEKPGHQPKTGHFTQVVWKSSTELGVGLATDGKTVFVVGQYKPAGNITNPGYFKENVHPKNG